VYYRFFLPIAIAAAFVLGITGIEAQQAFAQIPTFQEGDVIVSVSSGSAKWFEPDGTLVKDIDCTASGVGITTGSAFDSAGNFYMTMFSSGNQVCKTDNTGTRTGNFGSGYSTPESILFDKSDLRNFIFYLSNHNYG